MYDYYSKNKLQLLAIAFSNISSSITISALLIISLHIKILAYYSAIPSNDLSNAKITQVLAKSGLVIICLKNK